jgi:hypothetical protein
MELTSSLVIKKLRGLLNCSINLLEVAITWESLHRRPAQHSPSSTRRRAAGTGPSHPAHKEEAALRIGPLQTIKELII